MERGTACICSTRKLIKPFVFVASFSLLGIATSSIQTQNKAAKLPTKNLALEMQQPCRSNFTMRIKKRDHGLQNTLFMSPSTLCLPFIVLLVFLALSSCSFQVSAQPGPEPQELMNAETALDCSLPSELAAGLDFHPATPLRSFTVDDQVEYHGTVQVRCQLGFRLSGCQKIQCTPRGWKCDTSLPSEEGGGSGDTSLPICTATSSSFCPPLPEFVRGGSWRLESAYQLDQFGEGDVAALTCTPRFMRSTPSGSIACVRNPESGKLEWSVKELPACRTAELTCPPLIPGSLPSGVVMKRDGGDIVNFDCVKSPPTTPPTSVPSYPRRPLSAIGFQHPSDIKFNTFTFTSLRDGNYSFVVTRASPDLNSLEAYKFDMAEVRSQFIFAEDSGNVTLGATQDKTPLIEEHPHSVRCSERGEWVVKTQTRIEILRRLEDENSLAADDNLNSVPRSFEHLPFPWTALPDCKHVAFDEENFDDNHSNDFCPSLPFFSDASIPGWMDNKHQYPSNAMPLYSSASLDCGKDSWPESASTNADHTLQPTAYCVKYFRSKSTTVDDEDSDDNFPNRGKFIGRWLFRHGDGSEWTSSIPPTCVLRPTCEGLATYSGWRLASGLPPHKFYVNDRATCNSNVAVSGTEASKAVTVTCISDGPTTARFDHELDPSQLACQEVTCPNPGGYPLAYRSAQRHGNFIGHIGHHTDIDDDVRLDYFAVGDELDYHYYYEPGGFRLLCTDQGMWVEKEKLCY